MQSPIFTGTWNGSPVSKGREFSAWAWGCPMNQSNLQFLMNPWLNDSLWDLKIKHEFGNDQWSFRHENIIKKMIVRMYTVGSSIWAEKKVVCKTTTTSGAVGAQSCIPQEICRVQVAILRWDRWVGWNHRLMDGKHPVVSMVAHPTNRKWWVSSPRL